MFYVVADSLTLKQIASLNSRSERWKPNDFLNCYINVGIEHYKVLSKFMVKFPVSIMVAADLLMNNNPKSSDAIGLRELFESGEFKVRHEAEATDLAALAKSLFERYTFTYDRYLLQALQVLNAAGLCDYDRLKAKIAAAPMMMDKQPDKKKYLENIERVYNFKVHNRDAIY